MRVLAVLITLLMPVTAYGAECTKPQAVATPCSGVLLPLEAATDALKCEQVDVPRLVVDLDHQKQLFTVKTKSLQAQLDLTKTTASKFEALALKAIQVKPLDPVEPWWKSGQFIYGAGVATGVGAVVLGAWTANQVK